MNFTRRVLSLTALACAALAATGAWRNSRTSP